ncbi:MAG TPA: hypothetical protein VGI58_16520 [Streptosporangiaceae bacterium]|jgi:hypothetical protein
MFGQNIYLTYQAERPRTMIERRQADERRGEAAAMLSHRLRALSRLTRGLRTTPPGRRPQAIVATTPAYTTRLAPYQRPSAEASASRPVLVGASAPTDGSH